jgi:hypothetical protein
MDNPLVESAWVFLAKVVDFSFHPAMGATPQQSELLLRPQADTGAYLMLGLAMKKAWIQSAPWIPLALLALVLVWGRPWRENFSNRGFQSASRETRAMFLLLGGVLAVFSWMGFRRFDGLCFNQRYFLELVPLAAVALAWAAERCHFRAGALAGGAALGALLAAMPLALWPPTEGIRQMLLLKLPLILASLTLVAWAWARMRPRPLIQACLSVVLGASLGWSAAVHLGEDLAASRAIRQWRQTQHDAVAGVLPAGGKSAVFAYWGSKDGLGPLQLDHDVVIADPWIDKGADAHRLAGELLAAGRRVFVLVEGMPKRIFDIIVDGRRYRMLRGDPHPIFEVAASIR